MKDFDKKVNTPSESADNGRVKKSRVVIRLDAVGSAENGGGKASAQAKPDERTIDAGFDILHEDNHIIVVVKPRNIPTQADKSGDDDMLTKIKAYLIKKYNKPGDAYVGLLHRLDRPTGGVMVFAKTSKAASRISEQIREEEVEKTYCAVTVGRPNRVGRIEHYLEKNEKTNTVSVVPFTVEGAKKAVSNITVLDENDGLNLVRVELLTGRSHQARVQLNALGAPIVGDTKYAGDKLVKCPYLALWAYKLSFSHPVTGDIMTFFAQPPDEFPWNLFDTAALVTSARPTDRTEKK